MTETSSTFLTVAERELLANDAYGVFDWHRGHHLSYSTVEVTFGVDGFVQLAHEAALGRAVASWRTRSSELAALLDAEAALDALAGGRA